MQAPIFTDGYEIVRSQRASRCSAVIVKPLSGLRIMSTAVRNASPIKKFGRKYNPELYLRPNGNSEKLGVYDNTFTLGTDPKVI